MSNLTDLYYFAQSQGGGTGDAENQINDAANQLSDLIQNVGLSIAGVVFLGLIVLGFFTIKSRGLGQTFKDFGGLIVLAVLLGSAGAILGLAGGLNLFG